MTAPPWKWSTFGNGKLHLATPDRGHLIVMDFVRAGMQGAACRFSDRADSLGGLMHAVTTVEAARQFPDARVLEAAAELYVMCHRLVELCQHANDNAWNNGVMAENGLNEGEARASEIISEAQELLKRIA